jgi:quercetin dioxygenase-like cupin family protein
VKLIDANSLKPPQGDVATFEGAEHGANISFFIVQFAPGKGPKKHRHPYEETFILLDGEITAIVDGLSVTMKAGQIAVIPANTWHEFKSGPDMSVRMVNIHPVPGMTTEWA